MKQITVWGLALAIVVAWPGQVGAQDKGGKGKKKGIQPVGWSATVDDAKSAAATGDVPFGIFFCSEEVAKYAGDGSEAVKEYRKNASRPGQATPFEAENVVDAVTEAGLRMAKVAMTKDNAEIYRKYGVGGVPAFLLCAPTGDLIAGLAGPQFTLSSVISLLKNAKEAYAAWKQRHPPKPEKAIKKE